MVLNRPTLFASRNRPRIAFPRPLAWGMWWLSVLPPALSQRILRALGYGG